MEKGKINNVIRIPTSIHGSFFRYWIKFLSPFHNLTDREIDVLVSILKNRYELSKSVNNTILLDKLSLSEESRKAVKKECNMSSAHFQVILSKLKKVGAIVGELNNLRVNPKLIPNNLNDTDESFQLLLYFDFNGEEDSSRE